MAIGTTLRSLGFTATAMLAGCARCSSSSAPDAAPPTTSATTRASATAAPAESAPPMLPTDPPEVRDSGRGRATAALRAALQANGIAFDAAALERECKVDDDGASIDDLEDVAGKYGLDATQIILPAEHALLPEAKLLPAIIIVDTPDDTQQFVLAWRIEGDRVLVVDPTEGRRWMSRMDLQQSLDDDEVTLSVDDWRAAAGSPASLDALRARMAARGLAAADAQAFVDRAVADAGWRGLGALDAAIRKLEADPAKAAGDPRALLTATFDCAFEQRCAAGTEPLDADLWSVAPAESGAAELLVHGAVMLTIAGRKTPR